MVIGLSGVQFSLQSNSWQTNRTPTARLSYFVYHLYDYRPNWTPLSPITIINRIYNKILDHDWFSARSFVA